MLHTKLEIFKNILLTPYWLASVFTQAKSFKENPIIGSKILNVLGLHVFRLVLSHSIFHFKLFILSPLVSKEDRIFFKENGYIVKQNFLAESEFEQLKNESKNWKQDLRQCVQGDTANVRAFLHTDILNENKIFAKFAENKQMLKIFKYCSAKNELPRIYIEQVRNDVVKTKRKDPQKNLHSDTFHPTMKAWLFLEDVTPENGPFTYLPCSQKLTWKRIKWEYNKSINAKNTIDGYTEKGSFRFTEEDLKELGYDKIVPMTVPKNSLVIANTYGVHRRGDATQHKATRLSIWVSSRVNPFNPWVGFDTQFAKRMRDKLMLKYTEYLDKKVAGSSKKSPWHKVETSF